MTVTRTVFTIQFIVSSGGALQTVDVVASCMEDALAIVRQTFDKPHITLIQDKNTSVLVRV